MIGKLLGVAIFLLGSFAMAQDPTKVEPTHYKLAFENEHVQVVYIHYGPHESSRMHDHPAGVVVNISEGHLRFSDQSGKTQEVFAKRGEARWFPPFRHRVENLSDKDYEGVYIGVKTKLQSAHSKAVSPALNRDDQEILTEYLVAFAKKK